MGDFWRCVKANGFWTTLKMIDSKEFRAELYEAAQENYIVSLIVACNTELELTETQQWAYILDKERLGHSEEFVRAIEAIHEYEDDPTYKEECDQNWKDHKQRMTILASRREEESLRDPVKRAQIVLDIITRRYGLPQNEDKGTSTNSMTDLTCQDDF